MKYLRKYIQQIILESTFDLWRDKFDKDFARIPGEDHLSNQEFEHLLDQDDYTKHQDMFIDHDKHGADTEKIYKASKKTRRAIKQWWYDNADHAWIKDNVICLHSLSYYGKTSSSLQHGIEDEEKMRDLAPTGFFDLYDPAGPRQKDEMSCWAVIKSNNLQDVIGDFMDRFQMAFAVQLEGRITYASEGDAYSESRSKATASDWVRHASSGLPKRPQINRNEAPMLVQEDFEDSWKGGSEVIIDNWRPAVLYYNREITGLNSRMTAMIRKLSREFPDLPVIEVN